MEEDTSGRRDVEPGEQLGVEQRQLHHLLKLLNVPLQTTDLVEIDGHIHP